MEVVLGSNPSQLTMSNLKQTYYRFNIKQFKKMILVDFKWTEQLTDVQKSIMEISMSYDTDRHIEIDMFEGKKFKQSNQYFPITD